MKSVLISIQPKWCALIASGKKTVEVRKTKPNLEPPFKCYIYETQGKTEEPWMDEEGHMIFRGRGAIIGEFVCNMVTSFKAMGEVQALYNETQNTCITHDEIIKYAKGKRLYYWHISNLVIYEKPKELGEFRSYNCSVEWVNGYPLPTHRMKRPPQSWCYVEGA